MPVVLYKHSGRNNLVCLTGEAGKDFYEVSAFSRCNLKAGRNFPVSVGENSIPGKRKVIVT